MNLGEIHRGAADVYVVLCGCRNDKYEIEVKFG